MAAILQNAGRGCLHTVVATPRPPSAPIASGGTRALGARALSAFQGGSGDFSTKVSTTDILRGLIHDRNSYCS
jgi:hypothetical protein